MALSPVRLRASMSVGSADTIALTRSNSPALIASMKAAALSGIARFYLLIVFVVVAAADVRAQTMPAFEDRPPLGAEITVDAIGALPSSANLFALLDTVVPDVIADRIEDGGTAAGSPSLVGAHGSSWTQTTFRVGDADITSPSLTGVPLLMPGVEVWEHVSVATGMMPIDVSSPGMAVTLLPRRPAVNVWSRALEVTGSAPAFNASTHAGSAPAIASLDTWAHANVFLSGPLDTESPERL